MSDLQVIEDAVLHVARRQRWQRAWHGVWWGLVVGSLAWLILVILYKVLPVPPRALFVGGLVCLGCVPLGFLLGGWRQRTLLATARWIDQKLVLQERLSTALESGRLKTPESWRSLLLGDAAHHLQRLQPHRILPWRLPAASHWALITLVLAAGLGFVPEYRSKNFLQKQRDAEIVRDVGRQLADLTRRSMALRPPALAPVKQNLESTISLGDQLAKAKLTRGEALKEVAHLSDKLKQDSQQMSQDPGLKRLEQAARIPSGTPASTPQALQKKLEELQNALGKDGTNSQALDKLKKDLQKAQEAAAAMANNQPSGDSTAQQQRLAQSLAAMAQQAQSLGISVPGLQEAIQALSAKQTDLLVRDLQTALTDLEKLQAMAQSFQQLQQQLERMGKDLAEQLEKGQARAAQATLEKMVQQLQSSKLSLDQMRAIMNEVAKAVAPAGEYGKVGDLLKQGSLQMEQGQRQEASKSLAEAAKELEKLLGEMAELESLKEALASLEKGGMCLATGNRWGQGRPGYKPGGKGGRGFGDWAEEGNTEIPEMSELWQNPEDNRGQLDARSNTERGDGKLADNLDPTKVRGTLSPGNSMPAITLKGVSIKGLSATAYQDAVMAAQSDAQSALSQEQIPRAYQGAVKEYFDDLKK